MDPVSPEGAPPLENHLLGTFATSASNNSRFKLPEVPDHELLHPIVRGAYDEVWLARHTRLGSLRAVTVIRRGQFDDARPFLREVGGIRRYEPISRGHPSLWPSCTSAAPTTACST